MASRCEAGGMKGGAIVRMAAHALTMCAPTARQYVRIRTRGGKESVLNGR
jgi:hypothetical protein